VKVNAKGRVSDVRPYVERALKDDEVRENVKNALAAARDAYYELFGSRGATAVATRVATDEEIRDNLRKAALELRSAADRVRGREQHTGRNTALLLVGVVLGLLFNPITGRQTREWVKDKLFGPEETFSYEDQSGNGGTPTT
jgi:hypothetical protein